MLDKPIPEAGEFGEKAGFQFLHGGLERFRRVVPRKLTPAREHVHPDVPVEDDPPPPRGGEDGGRGGRIGKVTAMAGTMLSIKPVIHFSEDGQLQSIAKVRGFRQAQDKLVELCRERLGSHRRYNLAIEHGGASEAMEQLREKLLSAFPDCEHCWESTIDATLSVYIGKGVIGAGIQVLD